MTILMDQDVESDLPVQLNEDIERVIQQTLSLEHCPYECEVNITFTDNDGIRMINREFRELDVPTDVLSFPMVDYKEPADYDYLETEDILFQSGKRRIIVRRHYHIVRTCG